MNTPSDTPLRVLVIDDDANLLASITDGLELLGSYRVTQANDGAAGLEAVFRERPDCVVVDIRMPRLNGYQFIRAMRGDSATAEIPIVVLSALSQDHDQLAGMLSGADAYLFKPVDIVVLLREIERAFAVTAETRLRRTMRLAAEVDGGDGV